jgi:hypothetical protein
MGMNKANLVGMMLMMGAMSSQNQNYMEVDTQYIKKPKKKIIPKGCQEFFYGTNTVIARNKQNADKKAKKRGFFI